MLKLLDIFFTFPYPSKNGWKNNGGVKPTQIKTRNGAPGSTYHRVVHRIFPNPWRNLRNDLTYLQPFPPYKHKILPLCSGVFEKGGWRA
jgi:hypothetical protein